MSDLRHILLLSINYSHDIATALLAASGAAMWIIARTYPADAAPETERFFIALYGGVTRVAKDSLYWILLAGIPRVIFYMHYEWSDLAGNMQIVAVAVKHVVMFILVVGGGYYWIRLGRKVKELKHRLSA